jgi:hypothetical protein
MDIWPGRTPEVTGFSMDEPSQATPGGNDSAARVVVPATPRPLVTMDDAAAEIKRRLGGGDDADLEFLAQLYEDDRIIDTGTGNELQSRLITILEASSDGANGGVTHFVKIFAGCSDRGFRTAFQDPYPSSRNQVGHFTTAVDMGFRPMKTYSLIPSAVRTIMLDSTTQSFLPVEERVCMALIIGHEKVSDASWQANFFASFEASVDDVTRFFKALDTVRLSPDWNVAQSRAALDAIKIGNGIGNSMQDLHLSLYGYKLGRFIRQGDMSTRAAAAQWIRTDIGGHVQDQPGAPGNTMTG